MISPLAVTKTSLEGLLDDFWAQCAQLKQRERGLSFLVD